jgi:ribonuclease PH
MGDTPMVANESLSEIVGSGSGSDAALGIRTSQRAGRRDGRGAGTMREISVTQGDLLRCDGSSRMRIGLTDVLVAVYGPMECPVHRQLVDRADVHISFRHHASSSTMNAFANRKSLPGEAAAARDLREIVLQSVIVKLHPRKAIAIAVHVLSDDGGAAAAAINATFLALVDAGVSLRSVLTAACVTVHNNAIIVDPEAVEEAEADAVITLTFETKKGTSANVVGSYCQGILGSYENYQSAVRTARRISDGTREFMELAVKGRVLAAKT